MRHTNEWVRLHHRIFSIECSFTVSCHKPSGLHIGRFKLDNEHSFVRMKTATDTQTEKLLGAVLPESLPPVEKTPLLVLRFTSRASERLKQLVEQRLHQEGLTTLDTFHSADDGRTVLSLSTKQETLEREAELIHMMKRRVDTQTVDHFTVQERLHFCDPTIPFRDSHGLFTSSEWSLLAYRILDGITVLPSSSSEHSVTSELSDLLDKEYGADSYVHIQEDDSVRWTTGSSRGRLREHGEQSACLRHVLLTYDIVDALETVHLPQLKQRVLQRTWWPWHTLKPPVDELQSYYGCEIGFYFAWVSMLSRWLVFPGVAGLLVFLLRRYRGDSIDEDEYTPFYGLVVFVWAILFLRFLDRQEHRLAFEWGTFSLSKYEKQKFFAVRPEFRGFLRQSPVTGTPETYYPAFRRRLKFLLSAIATSVILLVAFLVMIMSLNLQGYIRPESNPSRWDRNHPHPFHISSLATLAEQDRIFDQSSSWRSLLPVVLHVICISSLNNIYRLVAERLTSWENHETQVEHRNSLVLKRFSFEAFDCYVALFYLAFYERDVDRLRGELIAVFQIDTLRRLLFECITPMVFQRMAIPKGRRRYRDSSFFVHRAIIPTMDEILEDLDKDSYEQFDDYMEVTIELGYVTLFASAYPLASLVSIAANWVEMRSDCFKMAHLCRRPPPFRTSGLGVWRNLMACVVWMSALTNCLIVGFTSDQLMHYLPSFYIQDETTGYTDMGHEKSWIIVFVIFGLERLLILIGLLIHAVIPEVPEDVTDQLERQHYVRMLEQEGDRPKASTSKKTD